MATNSSQAIKLFYCYAHKDRALRDELDIHLAGLRRSGLIAAWYDGEIVAGAPWETEIRDHLDSADVILLLVSPDFIHSDYCYSKEMTRAIERHLAKEARVIPVLLRPADWTDTPFSILQMLPSNAQPVTRWPDRDEAFEDVTQGIRRAVKGFLSQRSQRLITKNAIYYAENETMRGLIVIISQTGLSLASLLERKESLLTAILFHLERQTPISVQLEFLDHYGSTIINGFGVWLFEVTYNASREAAAEFPVNQILNEITHNSYALSTAASYRIALHVPKGFPLPPDRSWSDGRSYSSANGIRLGSFGYSPLDVSIYRATIYRIPPGV